MRSFHGAGRKRGYFEGFYFKHQCAEETLSLIPAYHTDARGNASSSLQIITAQDAFTLPFRAEDFRAQRDGLSLRLGACRFSSAGCDLSLDRDGVRLSGQLRYGPLTPVRGDVMGPFRFVPFMQCRHSVFSLAHSVHGVLTLNGHVYRFQNAWGYIEGDRGVSFPSRYLWTQCAGPGVCIMISVADIPFCGAAFTGCIATILWQEREYRLATYLGVKLLLVKRGHILLRQGALELEAELLREDSRPLRAPERGGMTRIIRESLSCHVRYRFSKNGSELFDFVSTQASFESVWGGNNS